MGFWGFFARIGVIFILAGEGCALGYQSMTFRQFPDLS